MADLHIAGTARAASGEGAKLHITVVACVAPREVHEWALQLPPGSCVGDALRACGLVAHDVGVWGRPAGVDRALKPQDRVEVYRPLEVDPKVARRERFARQGARATGLFARRRPGAKSGY